MACYRQRLVTCRKPVLLPYRKAHVMRDTVTIKVSTVLGGAVDGTSVGSRRSQATMTRGEIVQQQDRM